MPLILDVSWGSGGTNHLVSYYFLLGMALAPQKFFFGQLLACCFLFAHLCFFAGLFMTF